MARRKYTRAYIIPIVLFIEAMAAILISLIIGLSNGKVVVFMPYISDLGAHPPHGCIFAQMLNICAFLMLIVVYLRYRFTKEVIRVHNLSTSIKVGNLSSYIMGTLASVGVSFVGNFPDSSMLVVHAPSSWVTFSLGSLYQFTETVISWFVLRYVGCLWMNILRIVITIINAITALEAGVFMVLALLIFDGDDISQWKPEHKGFVLHAISAVNEWICVITTVGFLMTFAYEFRKVIVYEPELEITGIEIKE